MIGHDNDLNRFEKILRRDNREWDRNDISQNLFRRPTQLTLSVEIGNPISLCGAHTQLALPVEFLFEILYVGAPD